jgi:8-oxo-dGTP diphosphatase
MAKKKLILKKTKTKRLRPCKEVSVMAWVEDSDSRVLLVRQAAGRKFWTLPGGKVRPEESLQEALSRELYEETGWRAQADAWIDIMDRPDRGAIMILFTIKIPDRSTRVARDLNKEISRIQYHRKLPKNASPSAIYFWNKFKKKAAAQNEENSNGQSRANGS